MPRHRAKAPSRSRAAAGGVLIGGAALAGTALAGTAQAATPDVVPDLAPFLTTHNDVVPAPAPEAPPVESSFTAFDSSQPIKQLRDVAPAGIPAAGLIEAVSEAPKKLIPKGGSGGAYGE